MTLVCTDEIVVWKQRAKKCWQDLIPKGNKTFLVEKEHFSINRMKRF